MEAVLDTLAEALGHHRAGRLAQAETLYRKVLAREPGNPDALHLVGMLAASAGRHQEALGYIARAIQARGDVAPFHNNLGNAFLAQSRPQDAEACYREALRLKPDYAEAWIDLSGALMGQERFEEAVGCCQEAIRLAPGMADAYSNLGTIFAAAGRSEEAEAAALEALARKPGMAEPLVVLSGVRHAQKRFDEAEQCARQALAVRPGYAEAWNNLGNALQEKGRLEEAEARYQAALKQKPKLADAHYNLGNTLRLRGRLPEARACFERAIQLRPGYVKAHWNLSLTLLLAGELERGWEEFEWRWRKKDSPPRRFAQPLWDGSGLAGRTILLHAEQGLGDTIQFIRYAELVKNTGASVVVEAPVKLAALFETVRGADRVVPAGSPLPEFDVHAPLLSLPRVLRTSLAGIPALVPYLAVEPGRRARWEQRLSCYGRPRIGLFWRGNPQNAEDKLPSLDWETLGPVTAVPQVRWFSLQYGERAGVSQGREVVDLGPETEDFRDAAAAMEHMNLVISVDTSMAHLAGALARPVWLLLPFLPDWRWLLDRDDTSWYLTMRLFRQPRSGAWADGIAPAKVALAQESSKARVENRYAG